jgi:serine/threonine protein kinase
MYSRDIKPHNVMLDSRGHIILIDYGLSKQEVSNPTGAMSLVGTPDYSAPEVLRTGVFRSRDILPNTIIFLGLRMKIVSGKERNPKFHRKKRVNMVTGWQQIGGVLEL